METRIRETLINWAKFKDQVPVNNSDEDPLYRQKLTLLFTGQESLNNSTYKEWSKDVQSRLEAIESNDYSFTQGECLAGLIVDMVEDHLCIESWEDDRVTNQQWLAFKAMWHAIESLTTFSSKDLLEALDGTSIHDSKPSHRQIIESVELTEKRFLSAMKGSIEGDISPLLDLCDATFTTLLHAKQVSTVMAKGAGPRKAALKRNKPYRDTEKHAISLYERKNQGKEWNSMLDAVNVIEFRVMEYGKKVGVHWTTKIQANKLIYSWILAHNKNK
jgi:hypothetical protein